MKQIALCEVSNKSKAYQNVIKYAGNHFCHSIRQRF